MVRYRPSHNKLKIRLWATLLTPAKPESTVSHGYVFFLVLVFPADNTSFLAAGRTMS